MTRKARNLKKIQALFVSKLMQLIQLKSSEHLKNKKKPKENAAVSYFPEP